ncbi:MAG: hypothetical protein S4CHLAM45_00420 [Chlamydiales bacterium]|nr:hypothetical protein [Chlamydiales bacterium]MCH9619366.1 hypothetical protein [Chlamydiales bacterium]MCH9622170.1 hypothetical protein [Chlamydiales bacterium]
MVSSNSQNEERIRQAWIKKMVEDLAFPRHMIAVEKELSALPHLLGQKVPKRRVDILVFAKEIHAEYPLFPLLLIECKATPLIPKVASQVLGYNTFVKAPFVAIANEHDLMLGSFDEEAGMTRFEQGLLSYTSLISRLF